MPDAERPPVTKDTARGEQPVTALALAVVSALIAITCSSRGELLPTPASPHVIASTASTAQARSLTSPTNAGASGSGASGGGTLSPTSSHVGDPSMSQPESLNFPHLRGDLTTLEARARKASVRIVWFGDSHTAADFLTGEVRARLQARFGAGGPGFVRVGVKPYRHSQLHWASAGAWRIEPSQPARRAPFDDGIFGLGGMRAFAADAPAYASFQVSKGTAHGRLAWQLWFSLAAGASFRVDLAGVSQVITHADATQDDLPNAGFSRLSLTSALDAKLQLTALRGEPRFYGLTVEGSEPGVVLDEVGIDGARLATMLAWNEASFETALSERSPSLVVLAFGTNEAFDSDKVARYRAEYVALLARVRKAAPLADCWIVGPPDANAVGGGSEARVSEIDSLQRSVAKELGCGFSSQLEIMGGPGGYSRWVRHVPQLARGDRLHLTPKGYEMMGDALADALLAASSPSDAHGP